MPKNERTSVLRQARATTGIEGQDTRIAGGRAAHVTKNTGVDYQKDLGIKATASKANAIRANEQEFQEKVGTAEKNIAAYDADVSSKYNAAKGKIDKAKGEYGTFSKVVDKAWKDQKKGWIPVTLVDENNNEEGTYYLPKESAQEMAGKKGMWTNWNPKGNQLYVSTKVEGGRYIGEELHKALGGAEKEIYNKWYEVSAPTLLKGYDKLKGALSGAEKDLSNQYAAASTASSNSKTDVALAKNQRQLDWDTIKENYARRKESMAELFSNYKVKEAK